MAPITVHTQSLGKSKPAGTGRIALRSCVYYDVLVRGVSDGTVAVSITNDAVKRGTKMQYWARERWVDAGNQSIKGHEISGEIPVRSLNGTPIAIGTL